MDSANAVADRLCGALLCCGERHRLRAVSASISRGDSIDVTTDRGVFRYVVESTEIVKPNDVGVLKPGKSQELTLITCYPFFWIGPAPRRFIVHAKVDANAG